MKGRRKEKLLVLLCAKYDTLPKKQNSLGFIKLLIEGTEAWVTSGGLCSICMLAGAHWHTNREVMV